MSAIAAEGLAFRYGKKSEYALTNLSFTIEAGEFVCVLGHSGCGKSTLLNLIMGFLRPTEGRVLVNGAPVTGPGVDRGIVFQDYSLFPWMTAKENVAFGIRQAKGVSKAEAARAAEDILARMSLTESLGKYPCELSGGMRQRVAIARVLAMDAGIWLFDEPFSALDVQMRASLQALVEQLWSAGETRRTVVFVTHNVNEAINLADRILFIGKNGTHHDLRVPLKRPRRSEASLNDPAYSELTRRLAELFIGEEAEA